MEVRTSGALMPPPPPPRTHKHSLLQITERLLESEERKLSILKGELASVDQSEPVGTSKVGARCGSGRMTSAVMPSHIWWWQDG